MVTGLSDGSDISTTTSKDTDVSLLLKSGMMSEFLIRRIMNEEMYRWLAVLKHQDDYGLSIESRRDDVRIHKVGVFRQFFA